MVEIFLTWERKLTSRHRKLSFPNKMNPQRPTPRYTVIKTAKVKELILKKARERWVAYQGDPIRRSADFSATSQARRDCSPSLKCCKKGT